MKNITALLQLGAFIVLVAASSTATYAANDRGFFWKISHQQSTVYLFGSIHLANSSFYPLRDNMLAAFDQSDALVVEVNLNDDNIREAQRWLSVHGRYPAGQNIRQDLSAETYAQLSDYLSQQGLAVGNYHHQKPGLLVTAISRLKMIQLGLSPDYGLDMFFLQRAKKQQKNILQLETFKQQLQMLIEMPNPDLLVRQTLSQMSSLHLSIDQLIRAWKSGDEKKLNQLIAEDELAKHPEFAPIFDRLFSQRNIAMAHQITTYLKQPNRYFVVVGAGHLVGTGSIIDLLNKRGFQAERL